ncbi:type 1 glutamine amidotransferase [Bdellovibrio sp. HCB337]|uniref:type 1 glutamine amidotransferase n=1 Tax=Bdellovibrio sp. HCB337 TaxID=3394358 RepID=UPI0039A41010
MANKILIVQHEEHTSAGTTLEWAKTRGVDVVFWHPAQEPMPKSTDDSLGVVICGGSMDTFEEDKFPWLKTEKQFVQNLLEKKTKIFGLCLGGQLLAEVLGGKVYVQKGWEIGFVPAKTKDGEEVPMFHWHHCAFELPPGATLLIKGDYCPNQAFLWKDHVVGTQFHPEATEDWVRECAEDVEEKHQGNVQKKAEMLDSLPLRKNLQDWYFRQLDALFLKK